MDKRIVKEVDGVNRGEGKEEVKAQDMMGKGVRWRELTKW